MEQVDFGHYEWFEEKFGYNGAVGTSLETIWDGGNLYAWQASAESLEIVAEEIADTGIVVEVTGLDADYALQTVSVTTDGSDGQTPVAISGTFLRVFRAKVTSGTATGYLRIRVASAGATRAQINDPNNQTLMAIFTVPAGYCAKIVSYYVSTAKGDDATMSLFVRPFGQVFQLKHRISSYQTDVLHEFGTPIQFEAKADIDLRAAASVGSPVHGGFSVLLNKLGGRSTKRTF